MLQNAQINSLTSIFYNYGYYSIESSYAEAACYEPRNAILFLDSNKKIFEVLEICFACNRYEVSSNKMSIGVKCSEKLSLIKTFFGKAGILHGIKEVEH